MAEELTAGVWGTLKEAIHAYTGVSPATFFAAVAIAVSIYYVLSICLAPPPRPYRERDFVEREPLPPPVQVGEIDEDELRQYDGSDPKKPLLMAIKSQIYDVSQGRMFYGPGGPYAMFAGKDASRALAKMSFEEKDLNGDLSGLGPFELDALQDWEYKFMGKYSKVGTIKKPIVPVDGGSVGGNAAESTAAKVDDDGPSDPKDEQAAKVDDDGPSVPKGEQAAKVDDDGPSVPKGEQAAKVDDDAPSVPKGEQAAKVDDDGPSVPKGEQAAKVDDDGPSVPKGEQADVITEPKEACGLKEDAPEQKEPENLEKRAEVA